MSTTVEPVAEETQVSRSVSTPTCTQFVRRLIVALNESGIKYCHWKSNFSLAEAFAGNEDLDLLVDRASFGTVIELLMQLGFKQAVVRRGENPAGISHFYGHDSESGHLVHVHLFSRVLTGESFVKGHLLPFEPMLLADPVEFEGLKTARPAAELVLFLARNYIKYGSLVDLVYQVRGAKHAGAELAWLVSRCDVDEALDLAAHFCPVVPRSLWLKCIEAFQQNQPLAKRILLARRMRRCLGVYCIRSWSDWAVSYTKLLATKFRRTLLRGGKNKRFAEGGAIVAFVGPEATGKSTLVYECSQWFGEAVAVRSIHAGKPPSAWITWPINLLLPLLRRSAPSMRSSRVEGHVTTEAPTNSSGDCENPKSRGFLYAVRSVSLAWDRRRLLLQARRAAATGEIVVCDRYPAEATGAMDSPRISPRSGNSWKSRLYNRLVAWEKRLYRQIPPPDAVLKLTVSVETAKVRNRERIKVGKESDEYLESRHRIAGNWQRAGTKYITTVSTEGTLEETIERMKQTVWSLL